MEELRLSKGNLVSVNGIVRIVTEIRTEGIFCKKLQDAPCDDNYEKNYCIKGIPLTKDWANNFQELYLIENSSSRYYYRDGYYNFGILYLSLDFDLCDENYRGDCMEEIGIKLDYVHEAQNLFYAMNRKDLTLM